MRGLDTTGLHQDVLYREEIIRDYLLKKLDTPVTDAFESHYLSCDECFEEMSASQMLLEGFSHARLEVRRLEDVVVLQFAGPARLTRHSFELEELQRAFQQNDTRVLIDLSRVIKIDSAGLGQLIACYSHAVQNHGRFGLLRPSREIQSLLHLSKVDSLLQSYHDERQALNSFGWRSPSSRGTDREVET